MGRKRFIIGLLGLIAALTLLVRLEPSAERIEGRTVESWLREFAANRKVDTNVVHRFGERAVPKLTRLIEQQQRRNSWFQEFGIGDELQTIGLFDTSAAHQRAIAAGTWLSMLKAQNPHLDTARWSSSVHHWLDVWDDTFWAPKWIQLVITTPHESKAVREISARTNESSLEK